jgi:hypothetical protein
MRIRLDLSRLPVKSLITLRNQGHWQLGIDPAFEEAVRTATPMAVIGDISAARAGPVRSNGLRHAHRTISAL